MYDTLATSSRTYAAYPLSSEGYIHAPPEKGDTSKNKRIANRLYVRRLCDTETRIFNNFTIIIMDTSINMHTMRGGGVERTQSEIDADKEAWAKFWAEVEASTKPPHVLIGRNIHKNKTKRKSTNKK